MNVVKYNSDSFLVSSRTEDEVEYLVDLSTLECSCPGALEFKATDPGHPCAHVEAAMNFVHKPAPRKREAFTFFLP